MNSDNTKIESPTGAIKYSANKLKYSLVPVVPYEELVKVYTVGASKYAPRNWEKGLNWSDMVDAMERHLAAFKKGELNDKESNCKHMAAVAFYAFGLMEFENTHPELNDLPGFIGSEKARELSSLKYTVDPGSNMILCKTESGSGAGSGAGDSR